MNYFLKLYVNSSSVESSYMNLISYVSFIFFSTKLSIFFAHSVYKQEEKAYTWTSKLIPCNWAPIKYFVFLHFLLHFTYSTVRHGIKSLSFLRYAYRANFSKRIHIYRRWGHIMLEKKWQKSIKTVLELFLPHPFIACLSLKNLIRKETQL